MLTWTWLFSVQVHSVHDCSLLKRTFQRSFIIHAICSSHSLHQLSCWVAGSWSQAQLTLGRCWGSPRTHLSITCWLIQTDTSQIHETAQHRYGRPTLLCLKAHFHQALFLLEYSQGLLLRSSYWKIYILSLSFLCVMGKEMYVLCNGA